MSSRGIVELEEPFHITRFAATLDQAAKRLPKAEAMRRSAFADPGCNGLARLLLRGVQSHFSPSRR